MTKKTATQWVDAVIAAAEVGATRLPLLQRRPLTGPFTWSSGAAAPASLARWLAYDASWFARTRVPFPALAAGQIPTVSLAAQVRSFLAGTPELDTFVLPTALADASALVLRRDFARRTTELALVDGTDEPPILALRQRRDPFGEELPGVTLGLAWPSFGAWLAAQAGIAKRPRSPVAVEIGRELDALALTRFLEGARADAELELAPALAPSPKKVPLPPDAVPKTGFKELLREAVEGDDPARITALCRSPKAIAASRVLALMATIEGYEQAAIALLDFDPLGKRAFFNAAFNGRLEVLRACLDRGMDADEKESGQTPLEIAEARNQQGAIDVLRAHALAKPR